MKRWVRTFLILLVLGAILNVAVSCFSFILHIDGITSIYATHPAGVEFGFNGFASYGFPIDGITISFNAGGRPPRALSISHTYVLNWFGILYDTIFYAVILWLLFPGRYLMRRHRRIRRGLCGGCGYVVSVNAGIPGTSINCTECGTPIPEKLIATSPE